MPTTIIRILLNHCKWDKQKLLEKLTGNQRDELFNAARVMISSESGEPKRSSLESKKACVECVVCYLNFDPTVSIKNFELG